MRHYWLQAELSGETWDLNLYGLTPFFAENKGLSRKVTFVSQSDYNFIQSGESYQQSTFNGTMIFKSTPSIDAEDQVIKFRNYVARNTSIDRVDVAKYAFIEIDEEAQAENRVYKLRLYSQEDDQTAKFCYVLMTAFVRKDKLGGDIKYSVTFSMQTLWMIYRRHAFSNATSISIPAYEVAGDIPAVFGFAVKDTGDYYVRSSSHTVYPYIDSTKITWVIPNKGYKRWPSCITGEIYGSFSSFIKYWDIVSGTLIAPCYINGTKYFSSNLGLLKNRMPLTSCTIGITTKESYSFSGYFFWYQKYFED